MGKESGGEHRLSGRETPYLRGKPGLRLVERHRNQAKGCGEVDRHARQERASIQALERQEDVSAAMGREKGFGQPALPVPVEPCSDLILLLPKLADKVLGIP